MAKQSQNERNAGLEAVRIPLNLEALEQRILLSHPAISYVSDSPDPVNQGSALTLVAHTVTELNGDPATITSVKFYRSADNVANPLTDTLLGNGTFSGGQNYQWSGNATWAPGVWYYFAVATDSDNVSFTSSVDTGRVNALPTITSLTGSPEPTGPGSYLTLTANGVSDADGTVARVEFYHDANGDGILETGTDALLGTDYDGQNGWSVNNVLVNWSTGDYFARAVDNDGAYSAVVIGHVNQRPVIASLQENPNPAVPGQLVTFLASGVTDPDGTVSSVAIWRDQDGDGSFNALKDQLLGYASNQGGGNWTLTVLDNWQPGVTPLFFAVATDNLGGQSLPTKTLNQNPSVDGIQSDQSPIVLDSNVSLQAVGVQDSDGSIADVVFSVGTPPTWWPYNNSPTDQSVDTTLPNGWTGSFQVDWTITDVQQADFNNDGYTDLAVTVDVSNGGGTDFVAVLTNDGTGTFTTSSLVTLFNPAEASYNPGALTVGDFNEDGFQDIAVADQGDPNVTRGAVGVVSVLLNDGTGHFTTYTDYAVNYPGDRYTLHPNLITTADFTGDGHLDLVAYCSADGEMPVLLGDGTGAFTLNRIYTYGSSRWVDGNSHFDPGTVAPSPTLGAQDMFTTDLDQHEDGGSDLIIDGQGGLLTLFDYLRDVDTTAPLPNEADIFSPGNVIGRAFQTGITPQSTQTVGFHYTYRTGNTYDFAQGDSSISDDYNLGRFTASNAVDMYQFQLAAGQTLEAYQLLVLEPGQTTIPTVYYAIYDSTGAYPALVFGNNASGGPATIDLTIDFTAPTAGNYYLALSSVDLNASDPVDPLTGYQVGSDSLPGGNTDVMYTLTMTNLSGTGGPSRGEAAGNAVAAGDFMEDNYNNNGGLGPTSELKDTDLAIADSQTGRVITLFGNRFGGTKGRLAYGNLMDQANTYDLGHAPTAIAVYNVDSDTVNANPDWGQSSTGIHPDEIYNDIVTTNSDGTMSILINNGRYASGTGPQDLFGSQPPQQGYTGSFSTTTLNYTVANNAFGGPLDSPLGLQVGDFNGDGLADFAVAEKYDLATLQQGYPFHSSDPLDLIPYADELPYTDLSFGFNGRYSVIPNLGQRSTTYYATAFDNLYGYPNNMQYQGYSTPASLLLGLNQRPVIWSLTVGGDTLTANAVQDLDGYVAQVQFYRLTGASPDPSNDTLLGTDRNGDDGWTYTGSLNPNAVYYVVALDNNGAASYEVNGSGPHGFVVATHLNVNPTVAGLSVPASILQGDQISLVAQGVAFGQNATTQQIKKVEFFRDSNYDGVFEPGVDTFLGRGVETSPGNWTLEDWTYNQLTGQFSNQLPVVTWAAGTQTYFAVAQDADDNWSAAVSNAGTVVNLPPLITGITVNPTTPVFGQDVTLTALGVEDRYGQVNSVAFYVGNDDPIATGPANTDLLLGVDQSSAGGWSLTVPVTWSGQASYKYWAVVTDNNGAQVERSVTAGIDQPPTIDLLSVNPELVFQGSPLTLTATGVIDPDLGDSIADVQFYRDSNGNGKLDPGVDQMLSNYVGGNVTNDGGGQYHWSGLATFPEGNQTYFVRAEDNHGAWSQAAIITGRVQNAIPVIGNLAVSPNPATQGVTITLTASGVTDANGTITKVEFYVDSNGNSVFEPGSDLLLGTALVGSGGNYAVTAPVSWPAGPRLYFARAQDNEGAWSEPATFAGSVNAQPTIGSFTANPSPYVPGDPLTLTASNVLDSDGSIASVSFYRDSNGDGVFEIAQDALIYTDTNGADGWTTPAGFTDSTAVRRFFAVATDNVGGKSVAASLDLQRRPTIGSLTAAPSSVTAQQQLILTANNVNDVDGTIDSVRFYRDDGDGIYSPATDFLVGTDTSAAGGWSVSVSPKWGGGLATFYAVARDNEGNLSPTTAPHVPVATASVDFSPVIELLALSSDTGLHPGYVNRGDLLTLTATNVTDQDGTVTEVGFYRDADGNGVLDPLVDQLLGVGIQSGDDWSLTVSTAAFPLGEQTYFAQAIDNQGALSDPVVNTNIVNGLPLVGALQLSPNPVVRGNLLTLTALNVTDTDGTPQEVDFYLDDGDGIFNAALDTPLGQDTDGTDGWHATVDTVGWTPGDYTFFARAIDNLDAPGPATLAVGTVITSPSLVIRLHSGNDTGVSPSDNLTNLTDPVFDFVVQNQGVAGSVTVDTWGDGSPVPPPFASDGDDINSSDHNFGAAGVYTINATFDDGNTITHATLTITIDTTAPAAAPNKPQLTPVSDNGISNSDNITSILTPSFIISGVAPADYYTFYRSTDSGDPTQEVLGSYQSGSPFGPIPAETPGTTIYYTVQAFDAAGNSTGLSPTLAVQYTTAPATPAQPNLQAASDSGVSDTDNITNKQTLTFDTALGAPLADYTLRLWRGDTMVAQVNNATTISDTTNAVDGTYLYRVSVLDNSTGYESARSTALSVTVDRTAPTVTQPNIGQVLVVDQGVPGIADYGDVVQITWDNSAGGDNNPDVVTPGNVVADMTQYGGSNAITMYDDGTHGDETAGDHIWTVNYTIASTSISTQQLSTTIRATDTAGNTGQGSSTANVRVRPKLIVADAWTGFNVSIYDVTGNSDIDPTDVIVKIGKNNSIKSITIIGTHSDRGLGIVITGATSVGTIKDARKGPLGDIAFISSDAPIKSIQLRSGMLGFDLNGQTFGGTHFAADVDGDGITNDLTAIDIQGPVGKLSIAGGVNADILIDGNAGKLAFGGDFASNLSVWGTLSGLQVAGNVTAGSQVFVENLLSKLQVGGSLLGNAPENQMVQLLAGSIGKAAIGGNVQNSRIMAGAYLGADFAVGGVGADADSFQAGQIGGLKIGGSVSNSIIVAGLASDAAFLDLSAGNAFLPGSSIGKFTIGGTLTSTAPGPDQPFGVGSYQVGSYKINGSSTNPLVFTTV